MGLELPSFARATLLFDRSVDLGQGGIDEEHLVLGDMSGQVMGERELLVHPMREGVLSRPFWQYQHIFMQEINREPNALFRLGSDLTHWYEGSCNSSLISTAVRESFSFELRWNQNYHKASDLDQHNAEWSWTDEIFLIRAREFQQVSSACSILVICPSTHESLS